jgi:hypothetical protein
MWIAKIRASVPATDKDAAPAIDAFVRSQRWNSLQLAN